jgi:hypothetical protein
MRSRALVLALFGCLLAAGPSRADLVFQFADSTGTAGSAFTVNQGGTVDVRVYLAQTGGTTNLSSNGLVDGGVALQFSSSAPFTVASASAISPSSAFGGSNNTNVSTSSGTTTATLQVHDSSGVFAPTSGADANRILLGTFTFSGLTPGSAVAVTAFPDPKSANNVDGQQNNLDSLIHQSSAAITVVAVPEPGTVALCGLGAAALGVGAWRRRRRAAARG